MMPTRTVRMDAADVDRAIMLAAVSPDKGVRDVLHEALQEYIERHRPEIDADFARVQQAVLSGERDRMREVFMAGVPAQVRADRKPIQDLIDDDSVELTVLDDPAGPD